MRGTALEKSHIPKESWFKAVQRYSEKSLSARSLSQAESLRYPTSLRMLKIIRTSNQRWLEEQMLEGDIEIDEVFLGFNHAQGRTARPIIVLLSEKSGKKRTIAVEAQDSRAKTLLTIVQKYVKPDSHIFSDAHKGYSGLTQLGYKHTVYNIKASNNPAHCYLPLVHSQANQLRAFFRTFVKPPKSEELKYYLAEFSWRQSHRSLSIQKREELLWDKIMQRSKV